jgi:hypothetical protein
MHRNIGRTFDKFLYDEGISIDIDSVNLKIARTKLRLKSATAYMSFLSTVWYGEVILCCYSTASNALVDVYSTQDISEEDKNQLEVIIKKFLN